MLLHLLDSDARTTIRGPELHEGSNVIPAKAGIQVSFVTAGVDRP